MKKNCKFLTGLRNKSNMVNKRRQEKSVTVKKLKFKWLEIKRIEETIREHYMYTKLQEIVKKKLFSWYELFFLFFWGKCGYSCCSCLFGQGMMSKQVFKAKARKSYSRKRLKKKRMEEIKDTDLVTSCQINSLKKTVYVNVILHNSKYLHLLKKNYKKCNTYLCSTCIWYVVIVFLK